MRRGCRLEPVTDALFGQRGDLLEVVQDDQAMAAPGQRAAQLRHRVADAQRHPQAMGDGVDDTVERVRLRQVTKPGAAGIVTQPAPAIALRQPGLADTAEAEQRDQPCATGKTRRQFLQRLSPSDEGVALRGQRIAQLAHRHPQVVQPRHAVGLVGIGRRHEWRLGIASLKQLHRLLDPLDAPMATPFDAGHEPAQAGVLGVDCSARGRGQQGLPRQRQGHHPRGQ